MKLNYKRTFVIGLAFLSICAFWQMYDNVIPLILKKTFGLDSVVSGVIMAADNVCALFLLPLFGSISDKTSTRFGRRMPFVLIGTALAVVFMEFLPMLDNSYFTKPAQYKITLFIICLGCLLISMGTYRSPAVALMPDVTPKPLRSKANAVINLMGAVGGAIYLVIAGLLYSKSRTASLPHVDYTNLFLIVAALMVIAVLILFFTTDENKLHEELLAYEKEHPEENLEEDDGSGDAVLPPDVKKSLAFILVSISLWFIGYNAITTWFTTYAAEMWDMALGQSSTCLTIGTAGAIVSYIPIGFLASRIGRKKTIMAGCILLSACFASGYIVTKITSEFTPLLYIMFALVGLAWAAINVNSLPMVVEMCKGSDIGKFTGYYYTFSMAAQVFTPIASGWLIDHIGYESLFPYAALFVLAALCTMTRVMHGDSRPDAVKGIEALDVDAD
ncbi:MAG: MFS transporter [Oscillospiraceae bacterium]|nr:MFS transporter [Oscillospiraceae bacterium]MBR2739439.1 MFS transporter [Oscillospiraceae bacterium]